LKRRKVQRLQRKEDIFSYFLFLVNFSLTRRSDVEFIAM
jgi:hypothetical protein